MGHPVIGGVHREAFQLPDLTVDGMDALMAGDFAFAFRDIVAGDNRRAMAQAHADPHAGGRAAHAHAADVAVAAHGVRTVTARVVHALHDVDFLGSLEPLEVGQAAAQPDLAGPRLDQPDRHQPAVLRVAPGLDDQMGDRAGHRIDDGADDLATRAIRAAGPGPHDELRRHGELLSLGLRRDLCCRPAWHAGARKQAPGSVRPEMLLGRTDRGVTVPDRAARCGGGKRGGRCAATCGGRPGVLRTCHSSRVVIRTSDALDAARRFEFVQFLRLFSGHEPDFHQVERADEAVADPEAAGPDDRVAERHGPVVLQEDERGR